MNKRLALFTVLTAVFTFFAGCNAEEERAKRENKFGIPENSYFDTSDLEENNPPYTYPLGHSNPYTYYDFGDESCPEYEVFTLYESPDSESLAFDNEGRLRYYSNAEWSAAESDVNSDGKREKLSDNELEKICVEVIDVCVDDISKFEIESGYMDEESRYYVNARYSDIQRDDMDILANVQLNVYGDIRSISIKYDAPLSDEERAFFNEKVSAFVEEQKNPVYDYTYTGSYYRIDGRLYGLIDVVLEDEPPEGEDEGALWVECVGFVK